MKQIIILLTCLTLMGCTKSYKEVEDARARCTAIGGQLVLDGVFRDLNSGVTRIWCKVGDVRYQEGKF